MNSLREQIIDEVMLAFDYMEMEPIAEQITDRILALITEAMLSGEAVEAALTTNGPVNAEISLYEALHRVGGTRHRITLNALTAALSAAGITGAGQEGGDGVGDE